MQCSHNMPSVMSVMAHETYHAHVYQVYMLSATATGSQPWSRENIAMWIAKVSHCSCIVTYSYSLLSSFSMLWYLHASVLMFHYSLHSCMTMHLLVLCPLIMPSLYSVLICLDYVSINCLLAKVIHSMMMLRLALQMTTPLPMNRRLQ